MYADSQSTVPEAPALFPWKRGVELPPFTSSNAAAVQLLESILSGTASELPLLELSESVAIQIYCMIVEDKALSQSSKAAVYVVLASLAHRRIVPHDAAAAKRLDALLARKSTPASKTAPGLVHALRRAANFRLKDPMGEMGDMDLAAATTHLLKRWDLLPLNFDFGVATRGAGGGGGDDPGGGGSAADEAAAPPPQQQLNLKRMDLRTRALDQGLAGLALSCRRAAEARGEAPSVWAAHGLPASNVGKELIEEYQASLREEAEADGAADAELESDEEGEADEEPESADTAEDMQI